MRRRAVYVVQHEIHVDTETTRHRNRTRERERNKVSKKCLKCYTITFCWPCNSGLQDTVTQEGREREKERGE